MIAISDEQEVYNLHSCIERMSDADADITKDMTAKVLKEKCNCYDIKRGSQQQKNVEINNNEQTDEQQQEGSKFVRKLCNLRVSIPH